MCPRPIVINLEDPQRAIRKGDLESGCDHCNALKKQEKITKTPAFSSGVLPTAKCIKHTKSSFGSVTGRPGGC